MVPVGNTLPSAGSTQNLTAGQFGIFRSDYSVATALNITGKPYFYLAQGRINTYLQGTKRSDKISSTGSNVTDWYKVEGNSTVTNQITEISNFNVKPGDVVTVTLRGFSSYLNTLYFNGFTRSVTIQAPCLDCGGDPCTDVDAEGIVDALIAKFEEQAPGNNPDNITFTDFYTFTKSGTGAAAKLVIEGKALTQYGQPCDVAAFPYEYDRLWFRTFVYPGPATTADFIVADACNVIADVAITQHSSYPTGSSDEIAQLEKNYYSYQAGYLKHLYRMVGYNGNFESWVTSGTTYDTLYIRFNELNKAEYAWGDYIKEDSMVIIACPTALTGDIEDILIAALGSPTDATAGTPSGDPLIP